MCLISCGEREFLVFLSFFVCLCKHRTDKKKINHFLIQYFIDTSHDNRSIQDPQCVLYRIEQGYLNIYRLGTQSEPVLQSVLSEANTIKNEEAGRDGLFRARSQRVNTLVWDNAHAASHCVVMHLHHLI